MTKNNFFRLYYEKKTQFLYLLCKIIGHKWQKSYKLDTYNQYICTRCNLLANYSTVKQQKLSLLLKMVAIFVGFVLGLLIIYYLLAKFQLDWGQSIHF